VALSVIFGYPCFILTAFSNYINFTNVMLYHFKSGEPLGLQEFEVHKISRQLAYELG